MVRTMTRLLALVVGAGCGSAGSEPAFPIYEAKGKVVLKATGQPLSAGNVEFLHKQDPRFNCRSPLDPEGNFALMTLAGNQIRTGAAAGEYTVTVHGPMAADQVAHSVTLKTTYKVEAKNNFFEIALDRMP